jgi:hypothetical protein
MKNKNTPEHKIEKYNYLKSIKDKEQTILSYYKKISQNGNIKTKPIPKQKKRTKKNIFKPKMNDKKEGEEDNDEEEPISITDKDKKEKEKLTKKKQIVIMDD